MMARGTYRKWANETNASNVREMGSLVGVIIEALLIEMNGSEPHNDKKHVRPRIDMAWN